MKNLKFAILSLVFLASVQLNAQIKTPAASPSATVMQTVGLTDVTVEYSRPSAKGRTIFASEGLVPFGKVWRTGANGITKVTFSDDVTIEGKELAKGSYGVLTMPSANIWAVHFYAYDKSNWSSYTEKTPDLVVNVTSKKIKESVETFTIGLANVSSTSADLEISWENTVVPVKIGVEVDKTVMAAIEKTMAGPSTGDYYAAGQYYHESGKDLKQALAWVQKATQVDEPRFWQVRREALILADLGMTKEAIMAAKKSLELATAAGNDDYVKMNEKSIAEWSMKK